MSTVDRVKKVASKAGLLTKAGELKTIDSIALIDLVAGLEKEFAMQMPFEELRPESFQSLQNIASFIERVNPGVASTTRR